MSFLYSFLGAHEASASTLPKIRRRGIASNSQKMKYERAVSSRSNTEVVENPFQSFVNTNVSDMKRKATRLGDQYMLNFGGGFSKVSTKEKSTRQELGQKQRSSTSSKYHVQRGPPKALRRILRHLGKRKQVLSSFWLEHTVEKWKTSVLYFVFKAWVYVVKVKSKEEGRFIQIIKNMKGVSTKKYFERWVSFYQGEQKDKIKKNKEQAAFQQKINLEMLEVKSAEAISINQTLSTDIKYLKGDIESLSYNLQDVNVQNAALQKHNHDMTDKLKKLHDMINSGESSTPMLLQGCKSSARSFEIHIKPQLECKLDVVTTILSYLSDEKSIFGFRWQNPLLLAPCISRIEEYKSDAYENKFIDFCNDETALDSLHCRTVTMAWMEYHYHKQQRNEFVNKRKAPIVVPDDLTDGYVWSVLLDSVLTDEEGNACGFKRHVWKLKRQRERVRELLQNLKKLGIFAAAELNSYVKFSSSSMAQQFNILVEVMRKYPALDMDKSKLKSLEAECLKAQKSFTQVNLLKSELDRAIQSSEKINFATIGIQAEADTAYDSLVNRVKPFESMLRQQVKSIESLEIRSIKLLFSWPRLTNLWNKIVLNASIYSKRATEYAEGAALHTDTNEEKASSEVSTGSHDDMESGNILFSYSKLLFSDITNVYPNIKFVETDLLELQSHVRLNAVQIHKIFCTYLRSGKTKDLTKHSDSQSDNTTSTEQSLTYLQWWWFVVEYGFRQIFASTLFQHIFYQSICHTHKHYRISSDDVSIFSTCSKADFTLTLSDICSRLYPNQHPCESFPKFMEEFLIEDNPTNYVCFHKSEIFCFSDDEQILSIFDEHEISIKLAFKKYASFNANSCLVMSIGDLLAFLEGFDVLSYRIHEKLVRRIFREITGSISNCSFSIDEEITYIQFVLVIVAVFLVDESDPFKSRHKSWKSWITSKFKFGRD